MYILSARSGGSCVSFNFFFLSIYGFWTVSSLRCWLCQCCVEIMGSPYYRRLKVLNDCFLEFEVHGCCGTRESDNCWGPPLCFVVVFSGI